MIECISITNYALIDRTELEMGEGFSVITGETGAGKSILLGAIGLTLGQRAETSAIMDKERKCVVEIVYRITDYHMQGWFAENELDYSDSTVIRREVSADGKSRCFINDTPVNNKLLKEFGSVMIDIHSQHQSLLLAQPEYQTDILDAFGGAVGQVEAYRDLFRGRREKLQVMTELKERVADAAKEEEYLKFQFSRLESARLKEGEKEELEEEQAVLSNAEMIKGRLGNLAYDLRDMEQSAIAVLKGAGNSMADLREVMKEAGSYEERLRSVVLELNDIADEAERRAENIDYNPGRLEVVNGRLNEIYDLMYKYKTDTVVSLIASRDEIGEKLKGIQSFGEEVEKLEKEIADIEKKMRSMASDIHQMRVEAVQKLREEMRGLLVDLGIKHAEFIVSVTSTEAFTPSGMDDVRFLFAANKNQTPGELSKVASGGEISRVMLSLKYVLSKSRQLPVIVFDEIDTGLSGEVAHKMALMMREMSSRMQVISISHLPQIAAAGNSHFKVYKEDSQSHTVSKIRSLKYEERVKEIAGMISGSQVTEAAMETAKSLLNY